MSELVTLTEDGPLGPAGTQVWVDNAEDVKAKPHPVKKTAAKPTSKN